MRTFFSFLFLIFLCVALVQSEESSVDEADLFSDTATISTTTIVTDSGNNGLVDEKKVTGFSGEISTAAAVGFPRHHMESPLLNSYVVGNILADARLLGGVKGFINAEARYVSQTDSASFSLREIFLDLNFRNKAYFRAGRQILQWGRCYFWNPSDLISLDAKSAYFIQKIGYRDGAFGVKAHIPYGTTANLYGFIDMRGADSLEKSAGALKAEFLISKTEMAIAVWGKQGKTPVMSGDLSTRIFGLDLSAEATIFREDIENRMAVLGNTLLLVKGEETWTPRAAMNLSKSFSINGIPDRFSVVLEGYYNGAGYDSRIFKDTTKYLDANQEPSDFEKQIPPLYTSLLQMPDSVTKLDFFLAHGLYKPNQHAKYYAALFTSFSRFVLNDITLSVNAISNIEEACGVLSMGLSYQDLRDFTLGLTVSGNIGPDKTEYTFKGNAVDVQVNAGIAF